MAFFRRCGLIFKPDVASPDELWSRLNDEERQGFQKLVERGEAGQPVPAELIPTWRPWWEANRKSVTIEVIGETNEILEASPIPAVDADLPPLSTLTRTPPNPLVECGVLDLLLAYALICRRYDGAPMEDAVDAAADLWASCETLSNPSSVLPSPDDAVAVFKSKARDLDGRLIPEELAILLLRDTAAIMESEAWTLAALCDLHRIVAACVAALKVFDRATIDTTEQQKMKTKALRKQSLTMERKTWWFCCWFRDKTAPGNQEKKECSMLSRLQSYAKKKALELENQLAKFRRDVSTAATAREQVTRDHRPAKIEEL